MSSNIWRREVSVSNDIIQQRPSRKTDSRLTVAKMAAFCLTRQYVTMFTSPGNKTALTRIWQLTFITHWIIPLLIYYNDPLLVPFLRKSRYSLLICIANLFTNLLCNVCLVCLLVVDEIVAGKLAVVIGFQQSHNSQLELPTLICLWTKPFVVCAQFGFSL